MANMTMKRISNVENGFRIRTMILLTRGRYFCMRKPKAKGMTRPVANMAIREYGTPNLPCSKITWPSVKIHNGIIAANKTINTLLILEHYVYKIIPCLRTSYVRNCKVKTVSDEMFPSKHNSWKSIPGVL
jgi:hypothetical protein